MADHIRTRIRAAAKAALGAALPSSMGTVFAYRVWPIEPGALPLIAVHTPGDDVFRASPDADPYAPETIERVVDLRVTAYNSGGEEVLDEVLDAIAADVEMTLASGISVSGHRLRLDYQGAVVEYQAGDQPYGSVQMKWFVEVIQDADAPGELVA